MRDEESQQASIPKDYGTVPASADAGGSARRVVVIALAAIALFASGVAVGSSIATTPRGASVVWIEVAAAAAALRDSLALLPRKTAGGIFCAQTAKRGPS